MGAGVEDLVPLLSGKSSLGVTLVSLWAGEQVAEVVQQVWAASHGTTCSQQPQSTLANYYQALPPPLSSS